MIPILSWLIFIPLIGALALAVLPDDRKDLARGTALVTTILTFGLSIILFSKFNGETFKFQFVEKIPWIEKFGISYHLGVDGISIWLVMLTTFLMVISVWFSRYVNQKVKAYMALLLLLESAMLGVFLSLDLILFFVFFEATLVPMYFLINIWGGERRAYAALKFFLFTAAGSILMLVGMVMLAWIHQQQFGSMTFDLVQLQSSIAQGEFWTGFLHLQAIVFWFFMLAFLVKMPMFPFHTWLPDAHVEAPTAGSIILAGVLLKMGTYGILRFIMPLFPDVIGQFVLPVMILAVIGILYGGIVAAVQPDVKKLVAYSSVAHMGFVVLGIFSLTQTGIQGGAIQQLNHGVSTGALFLMIGLIYERRHTRMFKDFGGLKAQMPIYAMLFLIIMLSSVGLPGTNGFIGEFLALMGAFQAGFAGMNGLTVVLPAIAATGVIVAAVYLLIMFKDMFYGPNNNSENQRLKDIKPWEVAMIAPFIILIFWGGLQPAVFFERMDASLNAARLMATTPAGERPNWSEKAHEISAEGNLVVGEATSFPDIPETHFATEGHH
ncbi:MAG: NADH-quinone oxidoreductase subunit M [Chthonomonas sp.]|nr:NADH-quinone oxidoreductase subunit M [Chthonomonas sp.]